MIFLVTLVEVYPDGKSGRFGWALIWPDEYVSSSLLFPLQAPDLSTITYVSSFTESYRSLTSMLCRRAAKEDFWVYSATGEEQYDFVVDKTKKLPVKYLTTIKRSDPQTSVPVLRLVSRIYNRLLISSKRHN